MQRKKISFDLDGVIAEGGWVPVEERSNKTYYKKGVVSPEVIPTLDLLSILYDIYLISSRGHKDANLGSRAWVHFALGLELDTIAGVITHSGTDDTIAPFDKASIVQALGIELHIDDDPRHVEACGNRGVLFVSDMPSSIEAGGKFATVYDWTQLREFLTTPGFALHGSNGVSVVSPCDAAAKVPYIDPETVKALAESISKKIN